MQYIHVDLQQMNAQGAQKGRLSLLKSNDRLN